jgi:hypothetical protein
LRALPTSGGPLGADEKLAELDAVEALKLDNDTFARESTFLLVRLRMTGIGLIRAFVERHAREASAHYGACMITPRLPASSSSHTVID